MINQKHILRLYQAELITFAFLLPIYRKVIPYVIVTLILTWFIEGDFANKAKRISNSAHRLYTLLFASLYVVYVIGMAYSSNLSYGLFDLEVKMSLFIFPIIFASLSDEVFSPVITRRVLMAFVVGVFTSMVLCYSVAVYNFSRDGLVEAFYYSNLSVLIHPSYLALYVCFAIAILLYFNIRSWHSSRLMKILSFGLILLFELFVVMLSSKAGILSLIIVIALYASYIIFSERKYLQGFLSGGVLTISFMILFFLFPASSARFEQTREVLEQADVGRAEVANSTGERIMIWYYSFEITNENFFFGVGTGDVKDRLLDKYVEKGMNNALELELNAHNQYIQILVALGILGMITLMLNILLPALYSIEKKHLLYFIFLFLIAFNLLFESMLETQAGVVFYAFFNAYLFAIKKDPASVETGS